MKKKPDTTEIKRTDADRRIRQADRLATILRILQLLLGRGKWDAAALSAEFECDERTIYRYLKVLEFAGVPYTYDREARCYRVRPDIKFPLLNLDRDQLLSQATASAITQAAGLSATADAGAVVEKISASSPEDIADILAEATAVTTALDLKLADHSSHSETIKTIQWALIEGKQLEGEYASPYLDKPVTLTLIPYRLCLTGQAWYLIARPVKSDSPRTYRVIRFSALRMLDFKADVPSDFSLDEYFGNAWSAFRGEPTYDVEIEFTPEAADLVTETVWHKTQRVNRHADGRVTLTFRVDGLEEIVWWVLGWSGRAKIVKPVELRRLVLAKLADAVKLNQEADISKSEGA